MDHIRFYCSSITAILFKLVLGKPNEETLSLQRQLLDEAKSHLGTDNCHVFDGIEWSNHGGTNEESLADYLIEFGKLFEQKVLMLLDRVSQIL